MNRCECGHRPLTDAENCTACCSGHKCTWGCGTCFCDCHDVCKIKTPYGEKTWAYIKRLMDNDTKPFNPSNYPGICFPQWFEKEHAEVMLDRKLTSEEWVEIVGSCGDWLSDSISEQFLLCLREWEERNENKKKHN